VCDLCGVCVVCVVCVLVGVYLCCVCGQVHSETFPLRIMKQLYRCDLVP